MHPSLLLKIQVLNNSFNTIPNPAATMISRGTASRDIVELYNKLLPEILAMLQDVTNKHGKRISITLDAWTSSTQIPLLGINGHFIEPSTWKHKSLLLDFERLHGSHSASTLGQVTVDVLTWQTLYCRLSFS